MKYVNAIDTFYKDGMQFVYDVINGLEYAGIRTQFVILHVTSVVFNWRFFGNLGVAYLCWLYDMKVQDIDYNDTVFFIIGLFQVSGAVINWMFAMLSKKKKPYRQLFFVNTSSLFVWGGYRVIKNFPEISIWYYVSICLFISGISYLAIYLMLWMYPKLDVDTAIEGETPERTTDHEHND